MRYFVVTRRASAVIITLLLLMLLAGGCLYGGEQSAGLTGMAPDSTVPSFAGAVSMVNDSVVFIYVEAGADEFSGSGVILREDGYILTNKHVVEDATRIEVTLQDRQVYEAGQTWMDDVMDLAVIKIDARGLPTAKYGDPDQIRVGDWVMAVGHPLGLSPMEGGATVTAGIVSNLGRSIMLMGTPYYDVIQTDAAINPGNSGGPLINMKGEVIGINSVAATEAENIGFAINIAAARHVFEDVINDGEIHHPYLGVSLGDITPATACQLCLARRIGTVVTELEPDSPAARAGIQLNDVIVSIDGKEITSAADLIRLLWRLDEGQATKVQLWRGEREMELNVTLGTRTSGSLLFVFEMNLAG